MEKPALEGPAFEEVAVCAVGNALSDPVLEVYRHEPAGPPTRIATNDDWSGQPGASLVRDASHRAEAFPLSAGGKDAALLIELPPGAYTAVLSSGDGSEGMALVEVYHVH